MAVVHININRREYQIACGDGEEQHLLNLSYDLDKRVKDLSRVAGTGNQSLLLVLASLQMIDEMYELKTKGADKANIQAEIDSIANAAISQITDRIEDLAKKLDKKAG